MTTNKKMMLSCFLMGMAVVLQIFAVAVNLSPPLKSAVRNFIGLE